jgi:hypothetical protein
LERHNLIDSGEKLRPFVRRSRNGILLEIPTKVIERRRVVGDWALGKGSYRLPEWRVRCQDSMISVGMNAGRGNEGCKSLDEIQRI